MERRDLMRFTGRVINSGSVTAEAVVLDIPFSFIGDFDPETGKLAIEGHPLFGESLANKILVCPTGKGGTIAPFIAYRAWQKGNAPAAILCQNADPLLCESAITINIPILDSFNQDIVASIKTGQTISITDGEVKSEG
jgi:predicted aconitase with swiveling domain